jgi:MFS transporter, SP family, sugar:H+ symporter
LTLEQVDKMMEECTPMTSAGWKPTTTFAAEMGLTDKGTLSEDIIHSVERKGSVV